jgi:hypothetical protein
LISRSSPRSDRPVSASTSRPRDNEAVQLIRGGGLDDGILRPGADFGDDAVIDRAGGVPEVGEDVLIVGPVPIGDHCLDHGDSQRSRLLPRLRIGIAVPVVRR